MRALLPDPELSFTALDFETADSPSNSACAIGLVRVEKGRIVARDSFLIQPPFPYVRFTRIHGITWEKVRDKPTFTERWPRIQRMIEGVDYLAAHNAVFDRRVLHASCLAHGLAPPPQDFLCTVKLARRTWSLKRANLKAVCELLGIPLDHHHAGSDAEACAKIILAAQAIAQGE
ncbi:MAG: exonuclease [Deltaproteobacteria bacterium]|nr:MAG: exonuclease [Deltaproteobacteria bacterium]